VEEGREGESERVEDLGRLKSETEEGDFGRRKLESEE